MKKLPPSDFEKMVAEALKIESLPGGSSDREFLAGLNRRLAPVVPVPHRVWQIWSTGVWNGVAAVALGMTLLVGLNILPPFLVKVSVGGAGLIREKIVTATLQQQLWLEQFLVDLSN
jgi:hypothetical protein